MTFPTEILEAATIALASFVIGYAVRSYVSRLRRLRHQMQMQMQGTRWPLNVPITR
ncbi:MAG: hypothetical protein AB7K86_07870 [Rhodospirillales bacterium]